MKWLVIFCIFLLSACTDYVAQIEDKIEEQERNLIFESSDNSKIKSSSSVAKSSSSVKSSSSSNEKTSSSSVKEEKSSSSKIIAPVCAVSPSVQNRNGSSQIVIRFMPSWTNTSAIMSIGSVETVMTAVKNYCGWFEAKTYLPGDGIDVFFKQTVGSKNTALIPLDSIAALSDTLWVVETSDNELEAYACYPGILGNCPVKTLSVMMFDWYDGSVNSDGSKDGLGYSKDGAGRTGFDSRNVPMFGVGTSEDFGQGGCEGSPKTGMVEKRLGTNGVPVKAKNFPSGCKNASHLNSWFLPEIIIEKNGMQYTNVTCRELELLLTDDGYWLGQKDDESPEHGFFLLDDFRWLDDARTVENPYYDSISGGIDIPGFHNYGFSMKIQAEFVYIKGQYFEFNGDDDVWVFINNELVVDIGGQHKKVKRAVNLDTLQLTPGETYPFHIFYAERKRSQSNFMMRTSIDLNSDNELCP